jgi:hypothetical protein
MMCRRRLLFTRLNLHYAFLFLAMISSACFADTSGDIVTAAASKVQDGSVSVGFLDGATFTEYNTKYTVCPGVVGWCMDKCPGPDGSVMLNTNAASLKYNGFTYQPGILYINSGYDQRGVAVRFRPSKSQAVRCVGSFSVKPGGNDQVNVLISKNTTTAKSFVLDSAEKKASTLLSTAAEAGTTDSIYFTIRNPENERSGLVGVQLFVTPDSDKFDPTSLIRPAFAAKAP